MQLLGRMNQKMDQGYKVTSFYCTFCSGVTLMKDKQSNVYCPKCDKEYKPVFDQQQQDDQYYDNIIDAAQPPPHKNPPPPPSSTKPKAQPNPPQQDQVQKQYNEFLSLYNSTTKTASQLKSQKVSKKMGQLLVNGWGMMEEACEDCNVPLMRSKKGNLICCGCDRDYSKNVNESKVEIKKQIISTQNQKQQKKTRQTNQTKQEPQPPQLSPNQPLQHQHIQNSQPYSPTPQIPNPNHHDRDHHNHNHHHHHHHHDHSAGRIKMQEMALKTLQYIESRLEKAFTNNDLELIERLLKIMKNIKQLE